MARPLKLALNTLAIGLVVALVGVFAWQQAHGDKSAIPAGKKNVPAPAFALERLDGKGKLSLASLRGHPVIVNFWATWCEPCKKESAELEATYRRYRSRGLVVVGVDTSDVTGDIRAFTRKHDLTYPVVLRGQRLSVRAYGITGVPESFFVDRRGTIVGHVPGGINASAALHAVLHGRAPRAAGRRVAWRGASLVVGARRARCSPGPRLASERHPTLAELESEVMCPECKEPLNMSDSAALEADRGLHRAPHPGRGHEERDQGEARRAVRAGRSSPTRPTRGRAGS